MPSWRDGKWRGAACAKAGEPARRRRTLDGYADVTPAGRVRQSWQRRAEPHTETSHGPSDSMRRYPGPGILIFPRNVPNSMTLVTVLPSGAMWVIAEPPSAVFRSNAKSTVRSPAGHRRMSFVRPRTIPEISRAASSGRTRSRQRANPPPLLEDERRSMCTWVYFRPRRRRCGLLPIASAATGPRTSRSGVFTTPCAMNMLYQPIERTSRSVGAPGVRGISTSRFRQPSYEARSSNVGPFCWRSHTVLPWRTLSTPTAAPRRGSPRSPSPRRGTSR